MDPKFEFNTSGSSKLGAEIPTFSSISSLSRPRMVKIRKSTNTKSMGSSEARNVDPGFNPFRPVSDNVPGISSRLDSEASDGFGNKSGVLDGDGVSVSNRSRYMRNLKATNKIEKAGNELLDEIKKLRIDNHSNLNDEGCTRFSKSELPGRGVGSGLPSKLPEELKRLNLGGSVREGLDIPDVVSDRHGARSVGGPCGTPVAAELPIDLSKLNLRDGGEVGGRSFVFSTPSKRDFVFGSKKTNSCGGIDPGINSTLPDNLKSLKLEDSDGDTGFQQEVKANNSNQVFVPSDNRTASGSSGVDTMVLDEMEKLNIGGVSEESFDHANLNGSAYARRPPDGGMDNEDSLKYNLRENMCQVGGKGKHSSAPQVPECHKGSALSGAFVSSTTSAGFHFQPVRGEYQVPCSDVSVKMEGFSFTGKLEGPQMTNIEFRTPEPKANLFTGSNVKMGLNSKKGSGKVTHPRGRKGKVNGPNPVLVLLVKNISTNGKSIQHEPSESYPPMDVSPYCATQDDVQSAEDPSQISDNRPSVAAQAATSDDAVDKDLATATECIDINEAEDESFKSAADNLFNGGESEAESKHEPGSCDQSQYFSASSSISSGGSSFTFAASSSSHAQASAAMRHPKKKNRKKSSPESCIPPITASFSHATSSGKVSPISRASLLPSQVNQNDALSTAPLEGGSNLNIASPSRRLGGDGLEGAKKETLIACQATQTCDDWRRRGDRAHAKGDLEKAEDCYTQGLSCIVQHERSRDLLKLLVYCYSSRAAMRMSLGRIRGALQDCLLAAEADHNSFSVQLRAANCYLALGEIGNASKYFKKLLKSTDVCANRKIIVEASEGLQKAQRVAECINRSAECLLRRTSCDVESALDVIAEALVISPHSEQLLERRAEALLMLRRYEEVIQLCEQTLEAAEKNSSTSVANEWSSSLDVSEFLKCYSFRIWRYTFEFKSNFYLGKLEEALDFLEKQENWRHMVAKYGSETFESLIPQLSTARELIRLKSAGNEAFQRGRHTEAVERYTSALSFNVESRPFAAVCFGNRAAAYQALSHVTDAVADCSLAIALDRNYLKAISRRATLFEMIRDYDQAAKDLQSLVSLLTQQVEGKDNLVGAYSSMGSVADLRQARQRLYQMEEQAKKEIPLNFYLILGVEPSVTAADLKKAYRKAALRHHPDKAGQYLARGESGDDGLWKEIAEEVYKDADKLFKMIGEAYAVLSDPTKRSQYDIEEEMRNGQKKSGSSMPRMPTDTSFAERGGVGRQWQEGWRSSANPYSRGFEPSTDPYSRGFEPSRSGRHYK